MAKVSMNYICFQGYEASSTTKNVNTYVLPRHRIRQMAFLNVESILQLCLGDAGLPTVSIAYVLTSVEFDELKKAVAHSFV